MYLLKLGVSVMKPLVRGDTIIHCDRVISLHPAHEIFIAVTSQRRNIIAVFVETALHRKIPLARNSVRRISSQLNSTP